MIRNNNASGAMIAATASASGHINIYWLNVIQIANDAGGAGYALVCDRAEPTNYTVLVHDSTFNSGSIPEYMIQCLDNGIVFWNDTIAVGGINFVCDKYGYTASWNTPDTMGAKDTTGLANTYIEDCKFEQDYFVTNFDDNSRVVARYNTLQDAAFGSHGQDTSLYGPRHWEIYNNTCIVSNGNPYNLQTWFTVRGGTGVITGNSMEDIPYDKTGIQLNVYSITRGMNDGAEGIFCPLAYPAPRQVGWGWSSSSSAEFGVGDDTHANRLVGDSSPGIFGADGIGAVLDPVYIWGNTGTETTDPNYVGTLTFEPDNCGHNNQIATYLKEGRDYYVNVAKPNWSPYTYPHPLHAKFALGGSSPTATHSGQ